MDKTYLKTKQHLFVERKKNSKGLFDEFKTMKVGRNDACPCGSGSKYKRCCFSKVTSLPTKKHISHELIQKSNDSLKKRMEDSLGQQITLCEDKLKVKMSEVILDLAHDILEEADSDSERKMIIDITCMAWNLSLLSMIERKRLLGKFLNKMNERAKNNMTALINDIIENKNCKYPHIDRFIFDYDVLIDSHNIYLNVIFSAPEEELDLEAAFGQYQ